jgi:hypothetical protein
VDPNLGLPEINSPAIPRRETTESPDDFHSTGASYVRARTVGGRSLRVLPLTGARTHYIKTSRKKCGGAETSVRRFSCPFLVGRFQNSNHSWHSKNADFAGQLEFQLSGFMESVV